MPLTANIDFETTAPADSCVNPEDKNMLAVSYDIFFAFYSELNFDKVIIECIYGQTFNSRLSNTRSNALCKSNNLITTKRSCIWCKCAYR